MKFSVVFVLFVTVKVFGQNARQSDALLIKLLSKPIIFFLQS